MIARPFKSCVAALLLLAAPLSLPVHAEDLARATLAVTGEGEASAVPDMAEFSTGVVAAGKTAQEALAANSNAMADLISAIKAAGVEERDIATSAFTINPQYSEPAQNSREAPKLVGYEVRNNVTVRVRDLSGLGALLDKMVQSGANQAGGLRFTLADSAALEGKARIAALKDAQAQAKSLAEAAGMRLMRLRRVTPGDGGPVVAQSAMMMKADARSVPLEAGELSAHARITLVYEVEPM